MQIECRRKQILRIFEQVQVGTIAILGTIGLMAMASPAAHAGAYNVVGSQFAWDNNFNNSNIGASFSNNNGSPAISISYNFGTGNLYGYPACVHGFHYGWNPAPNDGQFPVQLSQASSIPCNFSYSCGYNGSGTPMYGDFAYDMFLRWDSNTSTPQTEVMVWGTNNSWPIGQPTAYNVLYAGGHSYDLWEGYNSAAGYYVYTFIPDGMSGSTEGGNYITGNGSLNVDMKTFYNWLAANRTGSNFNNNMYLDVIEAGLEVTGGNGWAWMSASSTVYKGGGYSSNISNGNHAVVPQNDTNARLDANGWSGANGTKVQIWNGSTQTWAFTNRGNGIYQIAEAWNPGACLDVYNGGGAGAVADIWGCWGGSMQQWGAINDYGNVYEFEPQCALGTRLDVKNGGTSSGTQVQTWYANGYSTQKWAVN